MSKEIFKASNGLEISFRPNGVGCHALSYRSDNTEERCWRPVGAHGPENIGFRHGSRVDIALGEYYMHRAGVWLDAPTGSIVMRSEEMDSVKSGRAILVIDKKVNPRYCWEGLSIESDPHEEVRIRYFAAHPDPKPWHAAQEHEVWEVTAEGSPSSDIPHREPTPMQVMLDDSGMSENLHFVYWHGPDYEVLDVDDTRIKSAKRVYPVKENESGETA